MTETGQKLTPEVLQLATADRAELAHLLIQSLEEDADPGAEAAWDEELERRLERIESGESPSRPANQVLAEILARHTR